MREKSIARFWSKVDKNGPIRAHCPELGPCWVWTACLEQGYGRIWFEGSPKRAHRVAWEITHGSIPEGMCVCHKCDNPPCCNPNHFFLGTKADNTADRDAKGRTAKGDTNGARLHPEKLVIMRGEDCGKSKLTESDIAEIRKRLATGEMQRSIAEDFDITQANVSAINTGKTWKHV